MSAHASSKAKKPHIQEDSIERQHIDTKSVSGSLSGVSSDVFSTLRNDMISGGSKDLSQQIFGSSSGHELKPGQESHLKKPEKKVAVSEGHMEYFREVRNADNAPAKQAGMSTERRVEEIRLEIKKLLSTSKQLEATFKSAQIEQKIVKAGKYHETLFDFIKSLLRSARVRMEEGLSWANTAKSKKQQRQYQNMAKKHGTSFTLNNERTVATQTG